MESIWYLNTPEEPELDNMLSQIDPTNLKGHGPLLKLRRMLFYNIAFTIPAILLSLAALFVYQVLLLKFLLVLLIVFCIWALHITIKLYNKIDVFVPAEMSLLATLKRYRKQVVDWTEIQQRVGLLLYPVGIATGALLRSKSMEELNSFEFLSNLETMLSLGVLILVLTPVSYYATRWIYNMMLDQYMSELEQNISDLES